jgi:hypothetical protein
VLSVRDVKRRATSSAQAGLASGLQECMVSTSHTFVFSRVPCPWERSRGTMASNGRSKHVLHCAETVQQRRNYARTPSVEHLEFLRHQRAGSCWTNLPPVRGPRSQGLCPTICSARAWLTLRTTRLHCATIAHYSYIKVELQSFLAGKCASGASNLPRVRSHHAVWKRHLIHKRPSNEIVHDSTSTPLRQLA